MELGRSLEDYLKTILILNREHGTVHSVDVAAYLGYTKPSVSRAVKELKKKGYLECNQNTDLILSEKGENLARKIYERHRFFTNQLIEIGVKPETAEGDACRIEHELSDESFQKLKMLYAKESRYE